MKFKQLFLISSLLIAATVSVSAESIGFSFNSDRDNTLMSADVSAGVVPSTGWVSTPGFNSPAEGANGSITNDGIRVEGS